MLFGFNISLHNNYVQNSISKFCVFAVYIMHMYDMQITVIQVGMCRASGPHYETLTEIFFFNTVCESVLTYIFRFVKMFISYFQNLFGIWLN